MIALRHVCFSATEPCTEGKWHLAHDDGRTLCGEPAQPEPLSREQIDPIHDWLCLDCARDREHALADEPPARRARG